MLPEDNSFIKKLRELFSSLPHHSRKFKDPEAKVIWINSQDEEATKTNRKKNKRVKIEEPEELE
jgi:hypothetical protein